MKYELEKKGQHERINKYIKKFKNFEMFNFRQYSTP